MLASRAHGLGSIPSTKQKNPAQTLNGSHSHPRWALTEAIKHVLFPRRPCQRAAVPIRGRPWFQTQGMLAVGDLGLSWAALPSASPPRLPDLNPSPRPGAGGPGRLGCSRWQGLGPPRQHQPEAPGARRGQARARQPGTRQQPSLVQVPTAPTACSNPVTDVNLLLPRELREGWAGQAQAGWT